MKDYQFLIAHDKHKVFLDLPERLWEQERETQQAWALHVMWLQIRHTCFKHTKKEVRGVHHHHEVTLVPKLPLFQGEYESGTYILSK